MDLLVICSVALLASALTLYSGFGLGTILMPVFAIFFPIDVSIALTAIVHFLNNILKLILLWKKANWDIVVKFGLPALRPGPMNLKSTRVFCHPRKLESGI